MEKETKIPWRYPQNVKQMQNLGGNTFLYLSADALIYSEFGERSVQTVQMPFQRFWQTNKFERVLKKKGIRSFVYDTAEQQLFVASISGLFCYSDEGKTELKTTGEASIYGTDLTLTQDGKLWVASVSSGILAYENTALTAQYAITENGKTQRFSCLAVNDKTVWAASDIGLWKINVYTGEHELLNRLDGLPSNNINDVILTENNVWVATLKGLVSIDLDHSSKNTSPPKIELLSVDVNNEPNQDFSELNHQQNNITFHVSPIAFRNRGKGKIKYRLVGHTDLWSEVPFGT